MKFNPLTACVLTIFFCTTRTVMAETVVFSFDPVSSYIYDAEQVSVTPHLTELPQLNDQRDDANDAFGFAPAIFTDTLWNEATTQIELTATTLKALPDNATSDNYRDMSANVLLLHLDEVAAATAFDDTSGQDNDATCTDCPTAGIAGKISTALTFNGSGNNIATTVNSFDPSNTSFTIEMWFLLNTLDNVGHQALLSQASGTGTGRTWLYLDDGRNTVCSFLGGSLTNSNFTPTVGSWTHIALTGLYNNTTGNTTLAIHINGVEQVRRLGVTLDSASGVFVLGASKDRCSQYLNGGLDEFAIYTRVLSAEEIAAHAKQFSGFFDSRIIDGLTEDTNAMAWDALLVEPTTPSLKPLPNDTATESIYSNGNVDMTNDVLLFHFDDEGSTSTFTESSGQNNTAACTTCPTTATGIFAQALQFNGIDTFISTSASPLNPANADFSAETWVAFDTLNTGGDQNILAQDTGSGVQGRTWLYLDIDTFTISSFFGGAQIDSGVRPSGGWHHVAITKDSTDLKIYVDGALQTTVAATLVESADGKIYFGANKIGTAVLMGRLDETAIYTRTLSAEEITTRYKRGVAQITYQTRSCDDALCDGETFAGPDGTADSVYTESENTTANLSRLTLAGMANNRYFQYRSLFTTRDATQIPALKSIDVFPRRYTLTQPSVSNTNGFTYTALTGFTETVGTAHAGVVRYQISPDGNAWFYHNGTAWASASSTTTTNTASEIHANVNTFPAGTFYFKAFLDSVDGGQAVQLNAVTVTYENIIPETPVTDVPVTDTPNEEPADPIPSTTGAPESAPETTASVSSTSGGSCGCNVTARQKPEQTPLLATLVSFGLSILVLRLRKKS